MNIVTFIGSSRSDGNCEYLTDVVLDGVNHQKVYLKDLNIKPIEDLRHAEGGFQLVDDDYDQIMEMILKSDILIFSTPIYWYSMTGLMKNMVDRFSQAIRDQRYPDFKDHLKTVETFVVAVGGDNPRIKGLPLIQQFQYTFDFLNMRFTNYVIGKASRPQEMHRDTRALKEAQMLNQQIKELVKQNKGK